VADITPIRLETEFVYLAVVALRIAFQQQQPVSGLVHHSDRGKPVRFPRLDGFAASARLPDQYESQSEPVGKRWL
jgi:hypothetical protein